MIRYPVKDAELRAQITKESKNWFTSATTNTTALVAAKKYDKEKVSENWSDIKGAFIEIQSRKCAYCERQLEEYKVEHDVEHFRPKGRVSAWPTKSSKIKYDFPVGGESDVGYYKLAFDYRNYAVACKSCNSSLKRDAFPVAGSRKLGETDPAVLAQEKPLLLFPLGEGGDDAAALIGFEGVVPVARADKGYDQQRARVTIDFFRLERRDHLRIERARVITALRLALALVDTASPDAASAKGAVEVACREGSAHSNCANCFVQMWKKDAAGARKLADAAQEFLSKRVKK